MSLCEIFYAKQLLRKSRGRRSRDRRILPRHRPILFEPLEPRLLLDASPLLFNMAALQPGLAHEVTLRVIDDAGTLTVQVVDGSNAVQASQALADTSAVAITGDNAADDTLIIDASAPPLPISFTGGDGSDRLVGPNLASTWNVTAANAGTVNTDIASPPWKPWSVVATTTGSSCVTVAPSAARSMAAGGTTP
jgi:hypothetical protein